MFLYDLLQKLVRQWREAVFTRKKGRQACVWEAMWPVCGPFVPYNPSFSVLLCWLCHVGACITRYLLNRWWSGRWSCQVISCKCGVVVIVLLQSLPDKCNSEMRRNQISLKKISDTLLLDITVFATSETSAPYYTCFTRVGIEVDEALYVGRTDSWGSLVILPMQITIVLQEWYTKP